MVQAPGWTTAGSEGDDLVGGHRELGQYDWISGVAWLSDTEFDAVNGSRLLVGKDWFDTRGHFPSDSALGNA